MKWVEDFKLKSRKKSLQIINIPCLYKNHVEGHKRLISRVIQILTNRFWAQKFWDFRMVLLKRYKLKFNCWMNNFIQFLGAFSRPSKYCRFSASFPFLVQELINWYRRIIIALVLNWFNHINYLQVNLQIRLCR